MNAVPLDEGAEQVGPVLARQLREGARGRAVGRLREAGQVEVSARRDVPGERGLGEECEIGGRPSEQLAGEGELLVGVAEARGELERGEPQRFFALPCAADSASTCFFSASICFCCCCTVASSMLV
jgi:hypothetical protein